MTPLRIFIGTDIRQPLAYHVCASSIMRRASVPVAITPLMIKTLPITRTGLTDFTFSRWAVPYLCGYQGRAIFLDADTLLLDDIAHLLALADPDAAVSVVKNVKKYEWPSVMVFENERCTNLTPHLVETGNPFDFSWANAIGELPSAWNHLVGYDTPRADAKLVHFTQGIPCFTETKDCEYAKQWHKEHSFMNSSVLWEDIMGNSVHAAPVRARLAAATP